MHCIDILYNEISEWLKLRGVKVKLTGKTVWIRFFDSYNRSCTFVFNVNNDDLTVCCVHNIHDDKCTYTVNFCDPNASQKLIRFLDDWYVFYGQPKR